MPRESDEPRPTLDEIRTWEPAVSVTRAAPAVGRSRAGLYQAIRDGECPVETIVVGKTIKVLTASLIRVLEGREHQRKSA